MISISKAEWKFVAILLGVVILLSFSPIIFGYLVTPPDKVFLFVNNLNRGDVMVYYSQIDQIKTGHTLVKNLFTAEFQPIGIFYSFWFFIGMIARFLRISSVITFQVVRFLFIPLFLVAAYYFTSYFFHEPVKRKTCFVFLVFASGFGWAVSEVTLAKSNVLGITVPETFAFTSMYFSAHFTAALMFIMLIFMFSCMAFTAYRLRYSIFAGILTMILFSFHPYHIYSIFGVLTAFLIVDTFLHKSINKTSLLHFFIVGLFSIPPLLYHVWTLLTNPIVYDHFLQNITITPSFLQTIIGYGLLLPLALLGIFAVFKKEKKDQTDIFVVVWLITQFFLLYLPVKTQVRLVTGLGCAMVVLVTHGLFYLLGLSSIKKIAIQYKVYSLKDRITKIASGMVLVFTFSILFFFTNVGIIAADVLFYFGHKDIFYMPKETHEAMVWLKSTPEDSVILSDAFQGNFIPMFSLRQVFIGHRHETVQFEKKFQQLRTFFQHSTSEQRAAFLRENRINYMFFALEEKKYSNFNPNDEVFFKKVFENNSVEIFQFNE